MVSTPDIGTEGAESAKGSHLRLGLAVAACALLLDQASKWAVLGPLGLTDGRRIQVAPFADVVLVWNSGISYGLFRSDGSFGRIALTAVALGASIFLLIWLGRETRATNAAALGLLIGGAVGNGIDRVVHGAVVDFVLLRFGGFEWYVFNVADAAIVFGVALLLLGGRMPRAAVPSA